MLLTGSWRTQSRNTTPTFRPHSCQPQALTDKPADTPVKPHVAGVAGGEIYSARVAEADLSTARVAGDRNSESGMQVGREGERSDRIVTPLPLLALREVATSTSEREQVGLPIHTRYIA